MKIRINKIFDYLDNQKFQSRLKIINVFICIISIFYIVFLFNKNMRELSFSFSPNIFHICLLIVIYLLIGIAWVRFVSLGSKSNNIFIFINWAFSNIGKYFPGSLGLITFRISQNSNKKEKSKKVLFGLLEEQFLVPIIAIPALVFATYINESDYFIVLFLLFQLVTAFLFKRIYFLNRQVKKISLLNQFNLLIPSILLNQTLVALVFFYFNFDNYLLNATLYLLASYISLFFVGVPAGLGIRETIYIILSGTSVSFESQIDVIIYIRLLFLLVEIFYFIVALILKKLNLSMEE